MIGVVVKKATENELHKIKSFISVKNILKSEIDSKLRQLFEKNRNSDMTDEEYQVYERVFHTTSAVFLNVLSNAKNLSASMQNYIHLIQTIKFTTFEIILLQKESKKNKELEDLRSAIQSTSDLIAEEVLLLLPVLEVIQNNLDKIKNYSNKELVALISGTVTGLIFNISKNHKTVETVALKKLNQNISSSRTYIKKLESIITKYVKNDKKNAYKKIIEQAKSSIASIESFLTQNSMMKSDTNI